MLMCVHDALDDDDPGPLVNNELDFEDDNDENPVNGWALNYCEILTSALDGIWDALPSHPIEPNTSKGMGISVRNTAALSFRLSQHTDGGREDPKKIRVDVAFCSTDEGDSIRMGFSGPGDIYTSFNWRCAVDHDSDMTVLERHLNNEGFTNIAVAKSSETNPRCPDCDAPLYPSEEGFRHPDPGYGFPRRETPRLH